MVRYIAVLILILIQVRSLAQEFYVRQYRVERGLPSDIVKATIQDSLGYFWIATDEGLVKYDGIKFTSYREAMHSNYAKGFFKTTDGRLLAFGDLDFIEIENQGDTVLFKSVFPVSRIANDSCLSYPKLVYEDRKRNIWVSESQAVVKLRDHTFRRYEFDLANRTPQFLRSFSFFEDQHQNLFVTSFQGNVFRYNPARDEFETIPDKFPYGVEFVSVENGSILIGAAEGLFEAPLLQEGGFQPPQLNVKIPFVSYVAPIDDGKHFIATRGSKHVIADIRKGNITIVPGSINNINHVYLSKENDILISGNEGLIMMRQNLFQEVDHQVADFIESITENPASGTIYFATSRTLYSFDPLTQQSKVLLDMPSGYFQSLLCTKEGLWVANAFRVFLLVEGKIEKQFDFSDKGRFITAISTDTKGNIWLAIPGSSYAYMIDVDGNLRHIGVPLGEEGVINVMREARDGMYMASAGTSSYLFFKSHADSVFRNVSAPLAFSIHNDFNVNDLVSDGSRIWLASSEGLLVYANGEIKRVNLGDNFTNLPVKSIQIYPGNKLLIANAFGLILYDTETSVSDLFNESSGLLSNTITTKGVFVSNTDQIWIGTAKGLCYSTSPLTVLNKTSIPRFTQIFANGKRISAGSEIDYGSYLSIRVSSITFPNEVTLQYRLLPDGTWRNTTDSDLHFSSLAAGDHTLEVKAKKNGPYSWSNLSRLDFSVARPFWQTWIFYLLCFIAVFVLVLLTSIGVNVRNEKKNRKLKQLIDERTNELRVSNEELINLNLEKNNLISIVAHDLRSPLTQVMSLISLVKMTGKVNEEAAHYLGIMKESVHRLDDLIIKILDVDAIESKQLKLKIENVNLSEICDRVANRYISQASKKDISIVKQIDPSGYAKVDKTYSEQVLENLVSNAIKFSPFNTNVLISLTNQDGKVVFEVRDEGPGLTPKDQKKLFGKYQKLEPRPTGGEISTGLGLSIAKKFVEAMDGEIWCESEKNKGASFFVSFLRS